MKIFVGNLSFDSTQEDVKKLFEGFGNVASVAIVMEKEKKAPKSRGFGFVDMPDEQQALAAIAALNGKEFMGRALKVDPARSKAEVQAVVKPEEKAQPPEAYKGGRRTQSYMKRRALAGIKEEVKPRRRSQDNPMRWRKKTDQVKPWQNGPGEHRPPWKKPAGEAKHWSKNRNETKVKRVSGNSGYGGKARGDHPEGGRQPRQDH